LDYHYAKIACVHAWVGGGQWKPFWLDLLSRLSSLDATGKVLLKTQATVLVKGKNSSLLGILKQIDTES